MYCCAHKTATLTPIQHTVPPPLHILADQITLFQSGEADHAPKKPAHPPDSKTLLRPCHTHVGDLWQHQLVVHTYCDYCKV